MDISFHNVVAVAQLDVDIDLDMVGIKLEDAYYDLKEFTGIIMNYENPKGVVLIFPSGRLVSTGCNTLEGARELLNRTVSLLKGAGLDVTSGIDVEFTNMVAYVDVGQVIDLGELTQTLGPESISFPDRDHDISILYKHSNGVTVQIQKNGKILATGSSDPDLLSGTLEDIGEMIGSENP